MIFQLLLANSLSLPEATATGPAMCRLHGSVVKRIILEVCLLQRNPMAHEYPESGKSTEEIYGNLMIK
jgi:hypothetical protein